MICLNFGIGCLLIVVSMATNPLRPSPSPSMNQISSSSSTERRRPSLHYWTSSTRRPSSLTSPSAITLSLNTTSVSGFRMPRGYSGGYLRLSPSAFLSPREVEGRPPCKTLCYVMFLCAVMHVTCSIYEELVIAVLMSCLSELMSYSRSAGCVATCQMHWACTFKFQSMPCTL